MYISNNSNIGMATLLQNNKNCMKTLSNGTSVVGVGTTGTNHIIVGNVVNSQAVGQQVGLVTSTNVPTQTITTPTQGGLGGSNTVTTIGGNLLLPAQTQTILLTNGATGASTVLTYQQYQQLLQQQQQQQRLLVSQSLVNLPIGSLINTGNGGLTVITDGSSNQNTSSANTSASQGTFLVATSSAASTVASSSGTSSFQQQFQQQLTNLQNSQNVTTNTASSSTPLTTPSTSHLQQLGSQQQQRLISATSVGAVGNNINNTTTIRHLPQFSQQQPANTINVLTNTATPNNSTNQQQRTTTVLINRNNNTIISGNTTQRLQHATILTKSPSNIIKSTQPQHHQGTIVVNNMAVQQVINSSNGQIISVVKTNQQQQQQQLNKNVTTKSIQQTTANLPQQQLQKQRYGTTNIQQIKHQQLKVVAANSHQTMPQRATIINSNAITKNHIISDNSSNTIPASKLINLNKATTTSTTAVTLTTTTNKNNSTYSQKQTQQQQQINGHFDHKLTNLQQQPATKLVPNGHNTNHTINYNPNNSNTNIQFVNKSSSVALSSPSNSTTTTSSSSSFSNTSTNYVTPTSALTDPNTSYMPTSNSQNQYSTLSSTPTGTATVPTTAHNPSNPPTTDSNCVSVTTTSEATAATTESIINNSSTTNPNNTVSTIGSTAPVTEQQEPEPEIDIVINNVVCSFSVRCHLNLREIALSGANVEYRRENGMVTMKLRRPYTTASIWSSGRITCTGATSEEQAKIAARRYARCLEKLGFRVRFHNFRVVNVLGTCSMPWAIKIVNFSEKYREEASYEPELHPGVTYKLRYPKATLKIFSTGSITVTAASVAHVQCAIEHIFPLVYEFRKKRSPEELEQLRLKQLQNATFEDITEIEDVVVAGDDSTVQKASTGDSISPTVSTLQRRRISNTLTKFSNAKRKRVEVMNEEGDADDPDSVVAVGDDEDDIVLFDPNESIIEGPDDDEVDL